MFYGLHRILSSTCFENYCLQMYEYLRNEASYGNETWKQQRSPYLASHETIKRNLSLVQTMRVFARTDTYMYHRAV